MKYKIFTEKSAAQIMKNIFSAIYYLHKKKIVHRFGNKIYVIKEFNK